ncbi:MAG TPA: hypothetical protein VGP07_24340 [Polyangia bacterium]|jgi:hypothetical protein
MVRERTTGRRLGLAVAAGLLLMAAIAGSAHANPRPLPFTYQTESLAAGTGEVEQFVDFIPIRVQDGASGAPILYNATEFQTEIEYGLTDKLEIALYFMFVPGPNGDQYRSVPALMMGNGSSQRVRYRFADPQAWPVDVAVYGEVTENDREIELEGKVILQRRIQRLRLITNLWAEREMYFRGAREWVLNPTLGATYEFTPRFHLGAEAWMRAEYPDGAMGPRAFNLGPHVFVGPAFMFNFGPVWWATGAYVRATDTSRSLQVGDSYGRVWVRTVLGLGF